MPGLRGRHPPGRHSQLDQRAAELRRAHLAGQAGNFDETAEGSSWSPRLACAARLLSMPFDPTMTESVLTLVWFLDAFEAPLPQEIERAATGLCWEQVAQDCDFS